MGKEHAPDARKAKARRLDAATVHRESGPPERRVALLA